MVQGSIYGSRQCILFELLYKIREQSTINNDMKINENLKVNAV